MVKKGFSLIELTVVIGLLTLLILAISGVMLMSIVGSNRIRTATATKQAGNNVLTQIQIMVRNARSLDCTFAPNSFSTQNIDGGTTIYAVESGHIASNSASITPNNTLASNVSFTCESNLVKISFDLQNTLSTSAKSNLPLHFETSVSLRNQ